MRDNIWKAWSAGLAGTLYLLFFLCGAGRAEATETPGDVLEFVDGSMLHGQLQRMDLDHGLSWNSPDARGAIHFQPAHIDRIRFAHADPVNLAPSCHIRFANGDDLFGSIAALDSDRLEFKTWFGGTMSIPRTSLHTITFLSKNYSIAYEGPYDASGWIIGNNVLDGWTYHDGSFIGSGPGTLARDLGLTNSTTVEFDLAWDGMFELMVDVYSDATDHLEYNSGSYVVEFTSRQITLRHVQSGGIPRNFGSVAMPGAAGQGKMRVTIQCNRAEGTVSVFINNLLARKWTDDAGLRSAGTGILFQEENFPGVSVKLSNLKISQWEGAYEPDTSTVTTNADAVHFVNHDRAAGKIAAIKDGKVSLLLAGRLLDVPLERVTQINFAVTNVFAERAGPWEVRAHFPGGGSLSFQLEKWDDKAVDGTSALFGLLDFQPGAIREMEFNFILHKENSVTVPDKEFEDLDE
jgi:hypothetical protein